MSRVNNNLKLSEVRATLPDLQESAECAAKLKAAMFNGVTEEDVGEIMKAFVKKAKEGDARAAKLVFDVVSQSAPKTTINVGVRANRAGEQAGGASVRVLDAELLSADHTVRLEIARLLGKVGALAGEDIAAELNYPLETVRRAADGHEWFESRRGCYHLNTTGRKEAAL